LKTRTLGLLISLVLTGCSLAGDITPPANVATAQAARAATPTVEGSEQQADAAITTPQNLQAQPSTSSKGIVVGEIENDTPGGSVPGNLEVNLVASDDQALVVSMNTTADENGAFAFDDVDIVPGSIYLTYVDYQGVRYVSDALHFPEGDAVLDLSVQIFETTVNDSGLRVNRLHLVFQLTEDGMLGVTQVWIINGLEDRTVTEGDGVGVVDVYLPDGFSNLGIDDSTSPEGRYLLSDTGFIDRAPVQPGTPVELVFGFTLPYDSTLDYSQPLKYAVDAVVVLLVSEELSVRADGLEDLGQLDMAGTPVRSYSMPALESGDVLELQLRSSAAMLRNDDLRIALIAAALLLIVVSLFVFVRRLRGGKKAQGDEPISPEAYDDRQTLFKAIADLDDAFEAGELSEDAYRRSREKLKDQALHLMQAEDD
jgi:hypothetical protein